MPIANDTIFDTFGVISSGLLEPADAVKLLMIGPEYTQTVIKTEKAVRQLRFIRSSPVRQPDAGKREAEKEAYQAAFAKALQEIFGEE